MKCFLIKPTGAKRIIKNAGPAGVELDELLFRRVDIPSDIRWCKTFAIGLEFGPGCMFFADQAVAGIGNDLWLIDNRMRYIRLNQYEWKGIPPMITIYAPPPAWALEDGIFEAKDSGHRDNFTKVSSRTEA